MIEIITTTCSVVTSSPYHPAMLTAAKRLNAWWDGVRWTFDIRDEDRVRETFRRVYGTDGTPVRVVDVRLDLKRWYSVDEDGDDRVVYFGGREICHRPSRDSRVRLGTGVILVDGDFHASGGSVKYPALGIEDLDELVVEVRDVPAGHPHLSEYGPEHGVTVLDVASGDDPGRQALRTERVALLVRLAEIDAELTRRSGNSEA
jgi:hypothetical protein